ncbi:MAG: hypothetical protein LBU65_04705 [Planctomycetaceae bacterium]|jgi:hypothetical protein|nr:hypothetical protein [Planctomycetaceae bacterium]
MYRLQFTLILCFCFIGCEKQQPSDTPAPSPDIQTVTTVDQMQKLNEQYEQLATKRLELQNKIEQAFGFYIEYTKNTSTQKEQLKNNLGSVPFEEAIEIFINGKNIPANLRLAVSCWKSLLPDETQRQKIFDWLEEQQKNDLLVEFEVKMKQIDNFRKVGTFLNESDQKEVDRLLVTVVTDWRESGSDLNYEQKAIETLKKELR